MRNGPCKVHKIQANLLLGLLAGWLAAWPGLAGWLAAWPAGWPAGWLAGQLPGGGRVGLLGAPLLDLCIGVGVFWGYRFN